MRAGPKSDAPRIMMALRGDPTLNPDEYTYLLLAEACAHMGWTHDVRSSIAMMRQQDGIQPGVKMFNYLLAVYAREGDVHNTEAVFREITTTEGLSYHTAPACPLSLPWEFLLGVLYTVHVHWTGSARAVE